MVASRGESRLAFCTGRGTLSGNTRERQMKMIVAAAVIAASISSNSPSLAATCYKVSGAACVKSMTGYLDSTCRKPCILAARPDNADDYLKLLFSKKAREEAAGEGLPVPGPFPW
jgi:hypothetical protein